MAAYNQYQSHPQAYQQPPVPGQAYDPRWYQRPPPAPQQQQQQQQQQAQGFQYTNQPVRQPYTDPRPQSQGFHPPPPPPPPANYAQFSHTPPSSFAPPPSSFAPPPSSYPHPQSTPTPGIQSRRPLPTPKARPESMPPPPRPLIQAPAPSRPAILTHSASLASVSPEPSSTSAFGTPASPSSSGVSGGRRPLPTPLLRSTKHASLDLRSGVAGPVSTGERPPSPVKSIIGMINGAEREREIERERGLPSSLTRRQTEVVRSTAGGGPTPPSTWSQSSGAIASNAPPLPNPHGDPDPPPSSPTKFVPLWKRNLPSASAVPAPTRNGTLGSERRSTVSGAPFSAPISARAPAVPTQNGYTRAESPSRPQPQPPHSFQPTQTQTNQSSPSRRPLPSSPNPSHSNALSRAGSLHQRVAASSGSDSEGVGEDISSPSDVSTDEDDFARGQGYGGRARAGRGGGEYEDEPITFADPRGDDARTPSPLYGIRDMPLRRGGGGGMNGISGDGQERAFPQTQSFSQTQTQIKTQAQAQAQARTKTRPARSATLPQPPSSFVTPSSASPSSPVPTAANSDAPQSLTLRFASMGLVQDQERGRERENGNTSPTRGSSPTRQQQQQQGYPSPFTRSESPTRNTGTMTPLSSPTRQGWPSTVPPLPRTPQIGAGNGIGNMPFFSVSGVSGPNVNGSPRVPPPPPPSSFARSPKPPVTNTGFSGNTNPSNSPKPTAQSQPRPSPFSQPSFTQSQFPQPPLPHTQQTSFPQQLTDRQRQKQRQRESEYVDLDDAPPPSLRRSPSPSPSITSSFATGYGGNLRGAEFVGEPPPRREWTPTMGGGGRGNADGNSVAGRWDQRRDASPTRRPQPPTQTQAQVPHIAFPDDHGDEHDSSDDGGFGPSITVSGPGGGVPSISVSGSGSGAPSISVSSPEPPSISFSVSPPDPGPPPSSISFSVPSPPRNGSANGTFGSRHTQIQQPQPPSSHPSKRILPPPPSSFPNNGSNAARPPPGTPARKGGLSCGGCNGPIIGRIVSAMNARWHPDCFRCMVCNELLEHVSSYEHEGRPYCHLDYHEAFAPRCFHCKTAIIDERFITLDDPALGTRTYHEQHFFCAECGDPFLAPSIPSHPSSQSLGGGTRLGDGGSRTGELSLEGDGEFADDDVGFTVYKGHPYCEACHVRLRMPKCKGCGRSIRDGERAVEALGGKWCWGCFVCESCHNPFEDPAFFLRDNKPFCEPCFSLILRNEV
ncbi:hypothetical protein HYDPIDRAFT_115806 [Hydnomerulius pinastri MD-312]|uniref:LIM zinc-binding domain-containing protein n=1 Tax=Hydnomerulius pinastri MD-312 TaxID=994086 RepID=A0A0C9WCH0_9AGAM|nr:hypothetical protein HYDPIDRAFT_115806 [Hydnomerulius pinastri MD-312]